MNAFNMGASKMNEGTQNEQHGLFFLNKPGPHEVRIIERGIQEYVC